MEEYQTKLAQLQEQQTSLLDMQMHVRERLQEARQAQQMLLQQENQNKSNSATWEDNRASVPDPANFEQLESETVTLRGKLAQLQTKKKHMDYLVAELQAIEASDRGSCVSFIFYHNINTPNHLFIIIIFILILQTFESSRNTIKDKTAELEALKAQLAHLKALMADSIRMRESIDSTSEPEQETDMNGEAAANIEINDDNLVNISFEHHSDGDDVTYEKVRNSGEKPTLEEVQVIIILLLLQYCIM